MKSTAKVFICILTLISIGLINQAKAHSETVANLSIEYAEDGLMITASLEKQHLTYMLKKEGACEPKNMLRVCANEYVKEHINIIINDKNVSITKESQRLTKNSLIVIYKVKFEEPIEKIMIKSDYMLKYNDHSRVKVTSKLSIENKTYNLSARRKSITIPL